MLLLVTVARAQDGTSPGASFVVKVVDETTQQPLQNAEVFVVGSDLRYLTNTRGDARVRTRGAPSVSIRVRQIGFRSETRAVSSASADTLVFSLSRVAYELPRVVTTADAACPENPDPKSIELSTGVLEQLRASAERYEFFRREYPFELEIGRRSAQTVRGKLPERVVEHVGKSDSEVWREPYRVGRVLLRNGLGFSVPILFLATLADSTFWAHHCFVARGVEMRDGRPVVRLEFAPTTRVETPDWAGVALLDSATSVLRRIEFRMTGLGWGNRPRRFEGYTTFATPSPFIVVPDTTMAVWWRREPSRDGEWGLPDVAQMLYIRKLTFHRTPPELDR